MAFEALEFGDKVKILALTSPSIAKTFPSCKARDCSAEVIVMAPRLCDRPSTNSCVL